MGHPDTERARHGMRLGILGESFWGSFLILLLLYLSFYVHIFGLPRGERGRRRRGGRT